MGNEVQNVTDVLLVCKGTDPKSRGSSTEKHFNLCEFANKNYILLLSSILCEQTSLKELGFWLFRDVLQTRTKY